LIVMEEMLLVKSCLNLFVKSTSTEK